MISIDKFKENLKTRFIGQTMYYYKITSSTNDVAKKLAGEKIEEGAVVVAEEQTRGRGRLGRKWFSPKGGLWFSMILKPEIKTADVPKITFVTSLAIANTLRKLFSLKAEVKWPNDILVNGKKICGILTESVTSGKSLKYVVVGVGLNSNVDLKNFPRKLRESTTTLREELKKNVELEHLFSKLLFQIEREYRVFLNGGFKNILNKWKNLTSFIGRKVEVVNVRSKYTGVVQDVDCEGRLVVETSGGFVRRFTAGDVRVVKRPNKDYL